MRENPRDHAFRADPQDTLLLRNARLDGEPTDIAVSGGVITGFGARAVSDGPSVDLDGRWVVPGLWDNHVHFSQWTLSNQRLDISAATSAFEVARVIGDRLARTAHPADIGPFIAVGFRDALWADTPTSAALDEFTGDTPVVVVSADLHAVWLNSVALAAYGLADHPTGLLREEAAFGITRAIDEVPTELVDQWAKEAALAAAARGVVGVIDYEMDWNLDTWVRRMEAGTTSLRVEFGIYSQHLDQAIDRGLRTGDRVSELLTVGGFKVLTDGSLNTRTAYCYEEYPGLQGTANSHGLLTVSPAELLPLMRRASAAGIIPAVHAIGDHANALALDAFETLGIRGRIEHAQLLDDRDIERFGALGVIASVQPEHALDDRDVADHHWAGRTSRAFVLRSLLDAGAELALGSDAPVAPLDPWVTIAAAVERTRGERDPWFPGQAITTAEALRASSRTAVAVGERADLAITDDDPLAASGERLRTLPVSGTLLGGRWTHNTFS
jgi:predicted amidohydrolase YtcJ